MTIIKQPSLPDWPRPGQNEPYYPLPTRDSRQLYDRYAALLAEVAPTSVFAGRLAKYRYFDMDEAVSQALQIFKRQCLVGARAPAGI